MKKLKAKLIWQYRKVVLVLKILQLKSFVNLYLNIFLNVPLTKISLIYRNTSIWIRTKNIIDLNVIEYVFYDKYHLPPTEYKLSTNPLILDLGSNIGATIIDFKSIYPNSKIIGYEMDNDNFNLSLKNCEGLQNVTIFNTPVWHCIENVSYNKNEFTDAFFINESADTTNKIKIKSTTLKKIITDNGISVIDYLKMDIEGVELKIFEDSDLSWLDIVLSLNIEFHKIHPDQLQEYIDLLISKNFVARRSNKHWLSIQAFRK